MERPIPYKGQEGYIFVSYAHKDSERVWPMIRRLQQDGYRVWYDEGIDPGTEWDENIAAHVSDCGCFIAVMTANYLNSDNCKDELKFSRDLEKPQILLYLENVELPQGMAMRIGRNPKVSYEGNEEAFFQQLYQQRAIAPFHQQASSQESVNRRANRLWLLLLPLAVLVIAVAVILLRPAPEAALPEETVSTPPTSETVADTEPAATEPVAYIVGDVEYSDTQFVLGGVIQNNTDQELHFTAGRSLLNGAVCTALLDETIPAGEERTGVICWQLSELENYGIGMHEVTSVEVELLYSGAGETQGVLPVTVYPQGQENAKTVSYESKSTDIPIMDSENFFAVAGESRYDETDGSWYLELFLQNMSEEDISACICIDNINGIEQSDFPVIDVPAGAVYCGEIRYPIEDWIWGGEMVYFCSGTLQLQIQSEMIEESETFALFL